MTREIALNLALDGWITRWQMENALQAQIIYQGSLITSLIKLGYISEERMLGYYSRFSNIPIIREDLFENVPLSILNLVTKDLVYKWRILPVGKRDDHLIVAMCEPPRAERLEQIRIITGLPVQAVLTTERFLVKMIRHYYAITSPSILLADLPSVELHVPTEEEAPVDQPSAEAEGLEASVAAESDKEAEAEFTASMENARVDLDQPFDNEESVADALDRQIKQTEISSTTPSAVSSEIEAEPQQAESADKSESELDTDSSQESLETTPEDSDEPDTSEDFDAVATIGAIPDEDTETVEDAQPPLDDEPFVEEDVDQTEEREPESPDFPTRLLDLEEVLLLADSRDDIIMGSCEWVKNYFSVSLFFTIKKSQAVGFHAEGGQRTPAEIKELEVSLNLASSCQTAIQERRALYQKWEDDTALGHIAGFCGLTLPLSAMVSPIILKGKPVGLLIGLDPIFEGDEADFPNENDWQQVKDTVSAAFESFILNKKLGV